MQIRREKTPESGGSKGDNYYLISPGETFHEKAGMRKK